MGALIRLARKIMSKVMIAIAAVVALAAAFPNDFVVPENGPETLIGESDHPSMKHAVQMQTSGSNLAAAENAVKAAQKCNRNTGGRCRWGASCYSWRKATCDSNSYCVCGSKCVVKGSKGNMCVDTLGPAKKKYNELTAKEKASKEKKGKESKAKEKKTKEMKGKEAKAKEKASKEKKGKEAKAKELNMKEKKMKEAKAKELANKEKKAKEAKAKELKGKEMKSKESRAKEVKGKEAKSKELKSKEKAVKVAKCKKDKAAAEQEGKQEYAAVQKATQEKAAAAGAVSAATKCNKNTGGRCRWGASCYSWRKATCDSNSYCVCGSKCVTKGSKGNMCVDKLGPANKQLTSASTQLDIAQGKLKAAQQKVKSYPC